jgi:hypothetical protein
MGPDGPYPYSRGLVPGAGGAIARFERVEDGRPIRFHFERNGDLLSALPEPAVPAAPPEAAAGAAPPGLVLLEVGGDPSRGAGEGPTVRLTLRWGAGAPRAAELPRPVLQRLVMGSEVDTTPGRPLPGLSSLPAESGTIEAVMVLESRDAVRPPWAGATEPRPGEEDPIRLARALGSWWRSHDTMGGAAAVVGTDPASSPSRWRRASRPAGTALLLLPDGGFPAPWQALGDELASSWTAGPVASTLPGKPPDLVVLVSAEAPALLGARLREISRRPEMRGRLLAVVTPRGAVRSDLPASLLAEGVLDGFGLAESAPVGLPGIAREIGEFGRSLEQARRAKRAVERVPGPFVWFY